MSGSARSRLAAAVLIASLTGIATLAARQTGILTPLDLRLYDAATRWLASSESNSSHAGAGARVAIVRIGEAEFQQFGHPIPDEVLARALRLVLGQAPRAVGVDIYRDVPVGAGRDDLRAVAAAHPQVVMVEKVADERGPGVAPPDFLDTAQVGFADLPIDADGINRRALLYLWDDASDVHVSFALRLALLQLASEGLGVAPDPERPDGVRIGATPLPPLDARFGAYRNADDGGYQFLVDYRRGVAVEPAGTLLELLADAIDPGRLRDRVVILGTDAPSVKDEFQTPLGSGDPVLGAEIHALVVDQLVRLAHGDAPLSSIPDWLEVVLVLVASLGAALVGMRAGTLAGVVTLAIGGTGAVLLSGIAALAAGVWVPVAPVALAALVSLGLAVAYVSQQERTERAEVMQLFGRFVSQSLADEIWSQRDQIMAGGRPIALRTTVTVLMSDLSGYTAACEALQPAQVMKWIGLYTDAMGRIVEEHGGFVNDFAGDGLMACFGVPVPREGAETERDAVQGVACALAMAARLGPLNERWRRDGLPAARMRVGVATGPVVVGAIGSARHLKYTAIGDVVNTASRLEAFEKERFEAEEDAEFRILVGESTGARLGGRFRGRSLGLQALRGKSESIAIYRVCPGSPAEKA